MSESVDANTLLPKQRVGRNAGIMGSANTIGGLMALVAVTLGARVLTPVEFGTVVFLHAVVIALTEATAFQSWQLVVREGSKGLAAGSTEHFARTVRFSLGLDIVSAIVGFSLSALFVVFSPSTDGPLSAVAPLTALGYFSLIIFRQTSASLGVLRIFGRYDLMAISTTTRPFLRMVGSICVAVMGGGLIEFIIAWFIACAASYVAAAIFGLLELQRRGHLRDVFSAPPTLRAPAEGAWKFTWLANVSGALDGGTRQLPLILVGIVAGPAPAGLFKIAMEVSSLVSKAVRTVDRVVFPAFAANDAHGDKGASQRLVLRTALAFALGGGTLFAALALVGQPILSALFGEAYGAAANTAAVLVLAVTLGAVASPVLSAQMAEGRLRGPVLLRLAGLLTMLATFWPFTENFGVIGSAAAVLAGSTFVVVGAGFSAARDRSKAD
ncbi:MAG: lipopolysaccharide biosynthesis protein [Pseudomonadota bacterium]